MTVTQTAPHRRPGSLLKELDLDKTRFLALVDEARRLKTAKAEGAERPALTGRNIALVFEKSSTRTRCAFETAAYDQGAHVTYLGPEGSHIGREESIRDTARVLGRMFDGIEFRGFAQDTVEQLADHAGVPVWNGLTDSWHPTQMLADILTMTEHHPGPLEQIAYCFLGDGRNNVARSLLVTGALLGMDVRIAAPRDLWPPADVIATAERLAEASGARVLVTDDVEQAVAGADFVYTDVWVSMGESDEQWNARIPLLLPYRVTEKVMQASGKPGTKFLHCLPSVHDRSTQLGKRLFDQHGLDGAEVTDDVFESPRSIVFDQAENRLHTIKAVLVAALGR
ncbi:ornithine carbamoyltransferase [Streptomyces sp. H10-C2]|uniref:ornithine carbamoyltransferase n=1 Tax=unclassified Streptomyces TaxID=2593676 RepID=UPI0024B915E2|nr:MULTISPECIES: ornithine carbamoyltransferase [unclassified Streptomyces]MDJ0344722.1 ornithine carbamoyltransferase [Streptomyces sp. PH10-H1]MDJ0371211.1 ornithine carbamoyltransferase [Streptomyces sp. H10-C2]